MNRRMFLLSASAAAMAAALPFTALAAIPTTPTYPVYTSDQIEQLGLIEEALNATAATWDSPWLQAMGFESRPHGINSANDLRDRLFTQVIEQKDDQTWYRVLAWAQLGEAVKRKFGDNRDAWRSWVYNRVLHPGFNVGYLVSTGSLTNLLRVHRDLEAQTATA